MANTKHEDAILKMGFDYFRDTILKILGIHHDFVESGITELVELTIHSRRRIPGRKTFADSMRMRVYYPTKQGKMSLHM